MKINCGRQAHPPWRRLKRALKPLPSSAEQLSWRQAPAQWTSPLVQEVAKILTGCLEGPLWRLQRGRFLPAQVHQVAQLEAGGTLLLDCQDERESHAHSPQLGNMPLRWVEKNSRPFPHLPLSLHTHRCMHTHVHMQIHACSPNRGPQARVRCL